MCHASGFRQPLRPCRLRQRATRGSCRRPVHFRRCLTHRPGSLGGSVANNPHDAAVGIEAVAFLRFRDAAAFELAAFADLQKLGRLADLHPVHGLEVGGKHLPAEGHEGARVDVVGLAQGLVGDRRENLGEVRRRMQGSRGDLVTRHAAHIDAGRGEELAPQLEQGHAAILAGGIAQGEACEPIRNRAPLGNSTMIAGVSGSAAVAGAASMTAGANPTVTARCRMNTRARSKRNCRPKWPI